MIKLMDIFRDLTLEHGYFLKGNMFTDLLHAIALKTM
jgi:hypothetical protein